MLITISGLALFSLVSFLLTGMATWFARRTGMLDIPGDRHSHTIATPRGGGLGIVLTVLLASLHAFLQGDMPILWLSCLVPGFTVLAIVGFLDDRLSLSARIRFLVQLAASLYLLSCFNDFTLAGGVWIWSAACLFMVWMTNLFNFMDGSNGMAASQAVFAGAVLAVLFYLAGDAPGAWFSALLVAASLGFLPWNLGKARVFMGDVGSVSVGYLIGGLLVLGVLRGDFSIAVAWLVMLVFLVDSSLTLLTRVLRGEQWYTPHKQHIYQRLIANGWKHGQVLLLYQLINLLLVVPVIVVAVSFPEWAELVAISTTSALAIAWFLALRKFGVLAISGKKQ